LITGENFSRKDAKAQSAAAFQLGFLCAFASLRESFPLGLRLFGQSQFKL